MSVATPNTKLDGAALAAWLSYLKSHAMILRELDAELVATHGITTHDYEVLLNLAQSEDQQLSMSELANRTMLTRSGITRLVDGLVKSGLIERVSCDRDARVSYAHLTEAGYAELREAGYTHIAGIERLFLANFSQEDVEQLAQLLSHLPGADEFTGGCCTADDDVPACAVDDEPAASKACALADDTSL
jgi:DNA-binding MarR family transcriptional regulator